MYTVSAYRRKRYLLAWWPWWLTLRMSPRTATSDGSHAVHDYYRSCCVGGGGRVMETISGGQAEVADWDSPVSVTAAAVGGAGHRAAGGVLPSVPRVRSDARTRRRGMRAVAVARARRPGTSQKKKCTLSVL
jgi:hypothetical protein